MIGNNETSKQRTTIIVLEGGLPEKKAANDNRINRKKIVKARQIKEPSPEMQLWKVVICQAIEDATTKSRKRGAAYSKQKAVKWITDCGEDFKIVCDFAGYSYEIIRRNALKIIAYHNTSAANDNEPKS